MNKKLYQVVIDFINEEITRGNLSIGDLIPSESQLSKLLNVSVGTVRKAIDILENNRQLYRHHGKGTYVSDYGFDNRMFKFTNITKLQLLNKEFVGNYKPYLKLNVFDETEEQSETNTQTKNYSYSETKKEKTAVDASIGFFERIGGIIAATWWIWILLLIGFCTMTS